MNQQALAELITEVITPLGLELDRLEISSAGKRSVVRAFLDGDGPEGRGPSLDDIAGATRAVSRALDESDVTGPAPYVLEVSSRGATRPLTESKHYRRNTGRLVALSLHDGSSLTGRIREAGAGGVQLEVDGAEHAVSYEQIKKAVVQVELNRLPDDDETGADGADTEE